MKRLLFYCILGTACVHAQVTATWNGGTGSWDDGTAWSTNPDFPNNGTPAGTTYNAAIAAGEVTRETATAIERLTMTGGKLVFAGGDPLTAAAGFDWSGGELYTGFGPGAIAAASGSTSLWSGSLLMTHTVVENDGTLTLADGIAVRAHATEYEVSTGLRNLPGGTVTLANSGSWLGLWFGEGPLPDGLNNQGTLIKNGSGTFTVGQDPDGFNAPPFHNSGTVTVTGGTLQIDAPVPLSTGTWTANAGSTIVFNGETTLEPSSVVQGEGNVDFAYGGGVSLAAAFPLTGTVTLRSSASFNSTSPTSLVHLVIDSLGNLTGSGEVGITGSLSWLGSVSGFGGEPPITLAAGATGTGAGDGTFWLQTRTFSNAGSFTWPGGTTVDSAKFDIFGGGQFRNEAGGSFTAAGNGTGAVTFLGTTTGTFTNEGTFDKSGAGTLTKLNWEFANTGLVRALGGRLEILKLISSGGSFESRSGAELYLSKKQIVGFPVTDHAGSYVVKSDGLLEFGPGKLVAAASFPDGTGTVSLAGAEVARDTIPAELVRFHATNSKVDPPSDVLTIPNAAITGGGVIAVASPNRVRVTGTLDWQEGGLNTSVLGDTAGILELAAGSTTTLTGLGTINSSILENAGTFVPASGSTLRVNALGTVKNTGTMNFGDGAVLELRPSTAAAQDATLDGGTITTTGTGVVRVFSGRNVVDTPSFASIRGATVNGTTELAANLSRLRLINGGDVKGTVLYTAITSPGASNITSVDIQQNATLSGVRFEDTTAAQAARSSLNVPGNHTVTFGPTMECVNLKSISGDYFSTLTGLIIDTGSSTITNEGTIRVDGASRNTQLAALDAFENRGTLRAENSATIFADREFTQTAGRIQLLGGNFFMTTPAYRTSTRIVTVSGGSVEGQGTFTGHLAMIGGTLAPGNTTGTLTLTGNLTLGGGSTLALDFTSASSADQLAVNGGVTLTGPVQLALAPAFNGATTTFTVLANDGAEAIATSPTALFAVGEELLEEGETFTASGRSWQISYLGGDGNDVTLTLQSGGLTAIQAWRQLHFGITENTGNAANTFDFDKDGIPNLVEFAFGQDPTSSASATIPQPVRSGGELVLSFTPPAGVSGITYQAEASSTLQAGTWTPLTNTGTAPAHEYRLPITDDRGFMRIGISEP